MKKTLHIISFVPYGDRWVVTEIKFSELDKLNGFVPYGDRWVVTARKNRLKKP